MLSEWADAHEKTLRVYPRLTNDSQFGMDEDTILGLIKNRVDYPHIEFAGIHFFSGTQKKKLKKHEKELAMLDAFFERLSAEANFEVPELEYGTGFAVSYFEDQKKKEEDLRDPEHLEMFRQMVQDMKWKGIVTIEMGRAYAAECGCYVTTALDIKENNGNAICLVDGGIHQLNYDGQIKGMYRPQMAVIPADEPCGRAQKDWSTAPSAR